MVGDKNQHSEYSLSENQGRILLLLATVVGLCLLHITVLALTPFAPYWDEVATGMAVKNFWDTGTPTLLPQLGTPNFLPGFPYPAEWEYLVEIVMRLPFYVASGFHPFHWGEVSSLVYVYVVCVGLWVWVWRSKPSTPILATLAIFLVLFFHSTMVTSEFHYLRYYPFLLLAMAVSHAVGIGLYLQEDQGFWGKRLKILGVTLIPAFFNPTALAGFTLWILFLGAEGVYLLASGRLSLGSLSRKERWGLSLMGMGVAAILGWVFWAYNGFFHWNWSGLVWEKFFRLNTAANRYEHVFLLLLVALSPLLWKGMTRWERGLSLGSGLFLLTTLTLFASLVSGKVLNNPFMYLLFLHPIWLWFLTSLISSALRQGLGWLQFSGSGQIWVYVGCLLILTLAFKFNHFFNQPHPVTWQEIELLKKRMGSQPERIVVLAEDTGFLFFHFPDVLAFSLRSHPDPNSLPTPDSWKSQGRPTSTVFQVRFQGPDHRVKTLFGETLVGNLSSFCQLVEDYPDRLYIFHRPEARHIEPALWQRLKGHAYLSNREKISAPTLMADICGE